MPSSAEVTVSRSPLVSAVSNRRAASPRRALRSVVGLSLGAVLAGGCFKPMDDLPALDFTEMPYAHPLIESDQAVLRAYELEDLSCPDGEPARIYAAYDTSFTGAVPAVLMLHSGAFDYIIEPDELDPLGGVHYRAESRLERSWALSKVWETVGMNPRAVDPVEQSQGALPATLVSRGAVVVLPANCWGDLWHGDQETAAGEDFERSGLSLARLTYAALRDGGVAGSIGLEIPVQIDTSSVHLVGLGSGARGIAELALDPANDVVSTASLVVDSPPDLLSAYQVDAITFEDELAGFATIYGEDALEQIDDLSLARAMVDGLTPPATGVIWSDLDVGLPVDAARTTAAQTSAPGFSLNTGVEGTIFTNADEELAGRVVDWMVDGTPLR
jgi:hypothetical protein